MTIAFLNNFYALTLLISAAAIVSGVVVLWLASHGNGHYFAKHPYAYAALIVSMVINCLFIYNILLWLHEGYISHADTSFHWRWLIYHTIEKMAILLFHHDIYKRISKWKKQNA